jgi:hypothetical protein
VASVIDHPSVVTMPTADEIFDRPAAVVEPDAQVRELLSIGCEMIAATTDDLAAQVLERICLALASTADALAIARIMLCESQSIAYDRHLQNARLRQRVADLLELAKVHGRETSA